MNKDGGPAFPRPGFYHSNGSDSYDSKPADGMSLRDWLAGLAMQALISNKENHHADVAGFAYEYADNMMAQREEKMATWREEDKERTR